MRNGIVLVVGLLLGILGVAGVAGVAGRDASPRPESAARWDYGILRVDILSWRERGRIVEQRSGPDFATALGAPYSNQSDVFEIHLLNALGDQGWELVSVSRDRMYVFKRPRHR
jgi:hypothetical protein